MKKYRFLHYSDSKIISIKETLRLSIDLLTSLIIKSDFRNSIFTHVIRASEMKEILREWKQPRQEALLGKKKKLLQAQDTASKVYIDWNITGANIIYVQWNIYNKHYKYAKIRQFSNI